MQETKSASCLKRFWAQRLGACLTALALTFAVAAAAAARAQEDEIPDSQNPVLLSVEGSTRALAADTVYSRAALPRKSAAVFQPGDSVMLFVAGVGLLPDEGAGAFRVFAQDAAGKNYRLTVEDVQPVAKSNSIYAVTVRIYDENDYNGQPAADGDVLIRLTWRGMTSNRVRLGLGTTGGGIKDDPGAVPTPVSALSLQTANRIGSETQGDRVRFMEQAAFGPNAATDLRLRQIGIRRWIDEQFAKSYPTFPYPDLPLKPTDANNGCPAGSPATCGRDHYTQYLNQNWMFKEALYGDDQLRRRVSWALSQIWVISGVDTQQQRWQQEYIEILDRNAFGNYRTLMKEMTLSPAMGNYLDMIRSTRTNPNENYPREILQLFGIGLDMLKQDGTLVDGDAATPGVQIIPTYDQTTVNNFTKVFTGWRDCNVAASCPNVTLGAPNYIDPMILVSSNHDLTQKTLLSYTQVNGQPAPNSTIAACNNCTTDATRVPYANTSLDQTLDNIFYHPNVGPFIGKLLIQQLVTSDPSPAYVGRVSAAFNDNGAGVRGDMKAVVKAILLDPEARGSRKTAPDYGKLREPFQLATNLLRQFDAKSADRTQLSDGYINPQTTSMGQNIWYSPTVFNYYPPDYVVPGTDVLGPEFGITNTATSFARINFVYAMVFSRINCSGGVPNCQATGAAPLGTAITLAEPQAWATADATGNTLIEGLNRKLMHGAMSENMKAALHTAIQAVPANNPLLRAQQAVYLVVSSSQYQVQR